MAGPVARLTAASADDPMRWGCEQLLRDWEQLARQERRLLAVMDPADWLARWQAIAADAGRTAHLDARHLRAADRDRRAA